MTNTKRWIVAGGCAIALALGGASLAMAAGSGDDEPLTGDALQRATEAALTHTGGGTVLETEAGDGGAAFGVEVRLPSGDVVEVSLDSNYEVIDQAQDDDGSTGEDDD